MANKIVQLVDKNSNNLYPIAGSVITDAVSTTAISNQAVTNPKIENGAVNGVANDATAIGTAKLALDTVGTPNLRDESVTSDKIDWTTIPCYYNTVQGISMTTSYTTVFTWTCPQAGRYYVFMSAVTQAHNNINSAYCRITKNGNPTGIGNYSSAVSTNSTAQWAEASDAGIIELTVGDIVCGEVKSFNATSGSDNPRASITIFRVG